MSSITNRYPLTPRFGVGEPTFVELQSRFPKQLRSKPTYDFPSQQLSDESTHVLGFVMQHALEQSLREFGATDALLKVLDFDFSMDPEKHEYFPRIVIDGQEWRDGLATVPQEWHGVLIHRIDEIVREWRNSFRVNYVGQQLNNSSWNFEYQEPAEVLRGLSKQWPEKVAHNFPAAYSIFMQGQPPIKMAEALFKALGIQPADYKPVLKGFEDEARARKGLSLKRPPINPFSALLPPKPRLWQKIAEVSGPSIPTTPFEEECLQLMGGDRSWEARLEERIATYQGAVK